MDSWAHYLSSAFGAGVHPSFRGSVTELYPFHFGSQVEGNMVTNLRNEEEGCGNSNAVATGEVISIGENSFKVRLANGEVYDIAVSPCTKMNSNKANHEMKKGNEAIVKGRKERKGGKIKAEKVTCLS